MTVDQIYAALAGVVFATLSGGILYWLKAGWDGRKEQVGKNEQKIDKTKESLFTELQKIYEKLGQVQIDIHTSHSKNKDRITALDKELAIRINTLGADITSLRATVDSYAKDVAKLEGRTEDQLRFQADFIAEFRAVNDKLIRIFEFIDAPPRATDRSHATQG